MKVVILYRPRSEAARTVETFVHDFKYRYADIRVELVDVDGREGVAMASIYDIMAFPTIISLSDDGRVLQMWQGDRLPLLDEVGASALSF